MIGSINRQTIIYKCIAGNGVIAAGRDEEDAVIVVADSIVCYGVVTRSIEVDAVTAVVVYFVV